MGPNIGQIKYLERKKDAFYLSVRNGPKQESQTKNKEQEEYRGNTGVKHKPFDKLEDRYVSFSPH